MAWCQICNMPYNLYLLVCKSGNQAIAWANVDQDLCDHIVLKS